MKWRGRWAILVGVAVTVSLTSCSDRSEPEPGEKGDSSLTFLGDDVVNAEKTLEAADAVWDRTQRGWDQVITVPDEARCYFLADDDGAVRKDAMCGPFRGLGSARPEWVLLPFEAQPRDNGSVELFPTTLLAYEKDPSYEALTLIRADGSEGDRDLAVPEPAGWPKVMTPGHSTIPPVKQFNRKQLVKTRVRMLGHDYSVTVLGSRKAQFPDRSRYVAQKGGALVDFRFAPFDSADAEEAQAALFNLMVTDEVTLVVNAGGRTYRGAYEIPDESSFGVGVPPYGPSGFFGVAKDRGARYSIVVQGQRFKISN